MELSNVPEASSYKKTFRAFRPRDAIVWNWEALDSLPLKLITVVESCGLSTVYERLASGDYEGVKDGSRTKITTASIKARRAKLPRAEYKSTQVSV
jgi:hypothetical protein